MGWSYKELSQICEILDKKRKPITKKNRVSGPYPYFGASGVLDYVDDFIFDEELVLLGEDGAKWGAGENSAFSISGKTWVNNHAHVLRPDRNKILDSWLIYYLNASDLSPFISGMTVPKLNQGRLREIEIPIPPVDEQKRIVAILDEAFADIDKARALTERNLESARELFESSMYNIFSKRGQSWKEKRLGELVTVERGSSPRPIKKFLTNEDRGVNWVKIGDVKEGEKYITTTRQKITEEGAERSRRVNKGDFVLSNSMSLGRPYVMATDGYIHDGWFVLRLPQTLDTDYFYYLLSSPYVKSQFQTLAAGAIVKNISSDLVKKALLPFPPLEEQRGIAKKLDKLYLEVECLERLYQSKFEDLGKLKQSLLKKAFAGELIKAART